MSNLRYRDHCCQKESEHDRNVKHCVRSHDRNVKHCVRSPHRYVTQLTDHEKFVENLSNLSLRQGPAAGCQPSSRTAAEKCCVTKSRHRPAAAGGATKATATREREGRARSDLCYPPPRPATSSSRCKQPFAWQTGKYVKDECGSGIVPRRLDGGDPRRLWCKTPLTMYQSTIGELARQMLCKEIVVPKRVNDEPPCNLCERVMPMCKGYYRKYECRRTCEEDHAVVRNGQKVYRDAIQQYWMPCLTSEEKRAYDLSKDADHNVYLGKKLKRKLDDRLTCW